MLKSESKQMAANELESRNEILNDNLDKIKIELYSVKKSLSLMENEKFDLEKEIQRLKKDLK